MKLFRSGQSSSFSNFHLGKCTTNFDGEEGVLAISVGILFWIGALPAVGDALGDHRVARFLAEVRSRKWQNSVSARIGAVAHRSEERRVGKEGVSSCRSRGSQYH